MKKKVLQSAAAGFLYGCFAYLLFSVAVSLRMGTGDFYFALPALTYMYHTELTAALIQMAVFCWFGTACGIAYWFSENRELPPAKQGAGYFVSLTIGLLPVAVAGQWFAHIFIGVFSYCIIVAVTSLIIFSVGFVNLKRDVEEIRQAIGIKEKPAEIPTEMSAESPQKESTTNADKEVPMKKCNLKHLLKCNPKHILIYNWSTRQIIRQLYINYGLFLLAFFTLGLINNRVVVIINFILNAVLCTLSLLLNIILFSPRHKTPIAGKIGLLSATLCFMAFTYFAFLMPENGMPPVLFGSFCSAY